MTPGCSIASAVFPTPTATGARVAFARVVEVAQGEAARAAHFDLVRCLRLRRFDDLIAEADHLTGTTRSGNGTDMSWKRTARLLVMAALAAACPAASAAKWQKLTGCRLVSDQYMDGDSFHVRHGNKEYIFRLYFVDAPETDREIADRITEQAAYWSIPELRITRLGRKAKSLTEKALKSDFTVYTQWEDAQGASQMQRFYAVVKIGHDDLAELLVGAGLARVYGATTPLPDGTSIDTYFQRLHQLEARAKRKKLGAWSGAEIEAEPEASEVVAGVEAEEEPPPAVEWPNVPVVAFLRAEAFVNTEQYEDAEIEMRKLVRHFPDHPQKARIEFYPALAIAMQERLEAIGIFREWLAQYPEHIMVPEVKYWLPIALSMAGSTPRRFRSLTTTWRSIR